MTLPAPTAENECAASKPHQVVVISRHIAGVTRQVVGVTRGDR
jgi:hypothetical protein